MTTMSIRHCYMALLLAAVSLPASGQPAGTKHAIVIGGLGGTPEYTNRFDGYLSDTRSLLVDRLGFSPDQVHVLGEDATRPHVDDVSTAENIRTYLSRLADVAQADDHVFVLLFGHGSYDGTAARLNIPRQDLDDVDYDDLLEGVEAGRLVFVNTSSASGPFAERLSGPNRIVIAATATGNERDETVFPRFFLDALRSGDGDLDKNGAVSLREAYLSAARQARQSFEDAGQIVTEHALLDDDGDGSPSRLDAVESGTEGNLAAVTYFHRATASVPEAAGPLLREKEEIQQSIAELKGRKQELAAEDYYAELESLFVSLARLNNRIEATP